MSIQKRFPVSRTSITAVVLLLCAVGFAYSQGWFDLSRRSVEIESDKVSTGQAVEHQNTSEHADDETAPVPASKE